MFDRTGDQRAHNSIRAAVDQYNIDRRNAEISSGLPEGTYPMLAYPQDDAYIGNCPTSQYAAGYSAVTVCLDLSNPSAYSRVYGGGSHGENIQPPWFIGQALYWDAQYGKPYLMASSMHELGHMMGLNHATCGNLMRGGEFGCYSEAYPNMWWTGHDWQALYNFYAYHPRD